MVNEVILVGTVGKDPEVTTTGSGVKVARFSLATSKSWKNDRGETVDKTEWHNIVVWRGLAEVVEKYITKGYLLWVRGEISYGSYDDKDGIKRYTTDIVVDNLRMLRKPADKQNQQGNAGNYQPAPAAAPAQTSSGLPSEPDDLPF